MQTTVSRSATDTLTIGSTLNANTYVIQSVLGRGAFGITYLALDQHLDRKVAIKEYLPMGFAKRDQDSTVTPLTGDHGDLFHYGLEGFIKEAKTTVKFNHANIVRVFAFFEEHNTAYIVMQYEVGENLSSYLKRHKYLSEQRLLEIFCPINDGLINVHKHGYIHRDIKPDNIYIREDNSPVLLDFGASRDIFNARVDQFTRILTKGYAPYEQDNPAWANQGAWTDIYALGATLFYTLTRQRVVSAQERASAFMRNEVDPYQSLLDILGNQYSPHFLKAIDHALAFHPDQRPQSIAVWNQALLGDQRSDDEKTQIILSQKTSPDLDDATQIYPPSHQSQARNQPLYQQSRAASSNTSNNIDALSNTQQRKQTQKNDFTSNKSTINNQANTQTNNQESNKNKRNWLAPLFFVFILLVGGALVYWLVNSYQINMSQIMASLGFNQSGEITSEIKQPSTTTNNESDSITESDINEGHIKNDQAIPEEKLVNEKTPIEQNDNQENISPKNVSPEIEEVVIVEDEKSASEVEIADDAISENDNEAKKNTEGLNENTITQIEESQKDSVTHSVENENQEQTTIDEKELAQLDEGMSNTDDQAENQVNNEQTLSQIELVENQQQKQVNQELLQRMVDAALNHAKTAARSHLRAEMDTKLIKDFESLEGMSNRTKYIANLKVQRDKFLVGFQQQFDLYIAEVEKLQAHKAVDIEAALTVVTDEKYQSSQTYIALGDLLMKHINSASISHKKWQADLQAVSQQSGVFK